VVVSRELLHRALRLLQAICKEAERRSWTVESVPRRYDHRPGIAIAVRGHAYPMEIHERTETLQFTRAETDAWRTEWTWVAKDRAGRMPPAQRKRKRATGRLRLVLPNGFHGGRATWSDGPRGDLEDKLDSLFETLEVRAEDDVRAARQAAIRAEAQRRAAQARELELERQRIERARAERLVGQADAWRRCEDVRGYLAALRTAIEDADPSAREGLEAWCGWGEAWLAETDPLRRGRLARLPMLE